MKHKKIGGHKISTMDNPVSRVGQKPGQVTLHSLHIVLLLQRGRMLIMYCSPLIRGDGIRGTLFDMRKSVRSDNTSIASGMFKQNESQKTQTHHTDRNR